MIAHHPLPSPPQTLRGRVRTRHTGSRRWAPGQGATVQTGLVRIKLAAALLAAGAVTAAPGSGQAHSVRAGPATNWPTYHADAARSGVADGLPAAGRLAMGWSRRLDGAVYGQPIVIGNLVIAATERDSVYGLARATGRVRWRAHVATALPLGSQPCGDIDPLGITSTPVYYRNLVYALAQDGRTRP